MEILGCHGISIHTYTISTDARFPPQYHRIPPRFNGHVSVHSLMDPFFFAWEKLVEAKGRPESVWEAQFGRKKLFGGWQ